MKQLLYIRNNHLDVLRSNIGTNIHKYKDNNVWIDDQFSDSKWYHESNIKFDNIQLKLPNGNNLYDVENTEIIYTALEGLTLSQASDERLWVSLTHKYFWEYMRKRWPVEGKSKEENYILERYFFMPNRSRAVVRNGLARLWWYGYYSYESNREDSFELTKQLLTKLDVAQSILERSISNVSGLAKAILTQLHDQAMAGTPFSVRDDFRQLMRYLNAIGGVKVLDVFDEQEIANMIENKIMNIRKSNASA